MLEGRLGICWLYLVAFLIVYLVSESSNSMLKYMKTFNVFILKVKPGMDFKNRGPNGSFGDRKGAVSTEVCEIDCVLEY